MASHEEASEIVPSSKVLEVTTGHSDSDPDLVIDFTAGQVDSDSVIDPDGDVEMAAPSESSYNYLDLESQMERECDSPVRLSEAEEDRLLQGSEVETEGSPEGVSKVIQAVTVGPAVSPMPRSESELGACGGKTLKIGRAHV